MDSSVVYWAWRGNGGVSGPLDGEAGEFPCPQEYSRKHGAIEATGVGIAQGRVVCGEKMKAVGKQILGPMGEAEFGFSGDDASVQKVGEIAVKGDLPQTDDDADAWQGLDLIGQMDGTVADLLRKRLVAWRGAANHRGDPRVS